VKSLRRNTIKLKEGDRLRGVTFLKGDTSGQYKLTFFNLLGDTYNTGNRKNFFLY